MKAYLNGAIVEAQQASVSIYDRGFLFGDGVYEVLLYDQECLVGARLHWQRLRSSLFHIDLLAPFANHDWSNIAMQTLEANELLHKRCALYVHITRGVDGEREHVFSHNAQPTLLLLPLHLDDVSNKKKQGVAATLCADTRHARNHVKSISLLDNLLLKQKAHVTGHEEALLMRDDKVVEASTSNLFVFDGTQLITPPIDGSILPGVMRHIYLMLAKEQGVSTCECAPTIDEVMNAQEVMITSSTKEMMPVVTIDGTQVGAGIPGQCFSKLYAYYERTKTRDFEDEAFCRF